MAPVGHTSLQSVQLSWQKPMLKFITGVQSPSKPALRERGGLQHVRRADVDALVALDAALERNSGSSTEPGGRISFGE